jgi:hypothetical protein
MLMDLKSAYHLFKEDKSAPKVGFGRFCQFRPKNCVFPGASGTHNICVCKTHENFKLILDAVNIEAILSDVQNYRDCIKKVVCDEFSEKCRTLTCKACPNIEKITEPMMEYIDSRCMETISHKEWVDDSVRHTLQRVDVTPGELVEKFGAQLKTLIQHAFVADRQAQFFRTTRMNLLPGQVAVQLDFSEKFNFFSQNEVQSAHWNRPSAVIHPFVAYVKEVGQRPEEEPQVYSFIVISNVKHQDHVTVHLCIKMFLEHLKKLQNVQKIFYFSDGAAGQYKNKFNFTNLCYHEEDFGIAAEWNFFATAHGKGLYSYRIKLS